MTDPDGIRFANPFNLEWNIAIPWDGLSADQTNLPYCQFDDPVMGLRAGMVDARTKIYKHGLYTLRRLLTIFAPPSENNLESYIADVAGRLGISANSPLDLSTADKLVAYAKAIVTHEQGHCSTAPDWYSDAQYAQAAQMALENTVAKA